MLTSELGCLFPRPRQQREKQFKPLCLELEVGWQFPETRPQLRTKVQQALGEKVRQRPFDIPQSKHVRYIARALDGESKVGRCLGTPLGKTFWPLQGVKRSIQLDGIE